MRIFVEKKSAQSAMWLAGIALLLLSIPLTASAELGGDATSVVADQARMAES
jgi:hypothetical protein